jgi:hypothetical protein
MLMRKILLWVALTALVSTVVTTLALTSALAGHTPSAGPSKVQRVSPNTVTGPKKLLQTKFSYGNVNATVGSGFQAIDAPFIFTCPGTSTCAYEVQQHVQVAGSTDGNLWAICTKIDGVDLSQPGCPFLGDIPNGTFGSGSFSQGASGIAHGQHTLQTFLYSDDGATIYNYRFTYSLYKAA